MLLEVSGVKQIEEKATMSPFSRKFRNLMQTTLKAVLQWNGIPKVTYMEFRTFVHKVPRLI
jgi:hypothetical protein